MQGGGPPFRLSPSTDDAALLVFREASSVIANPEAGILTVRATLRQHEELQEFFDQVLVNAKRQVLLEVTIVDVQLGTNYQQGIDFNILRTGTAGFSGGIIPQGTALVASPTGSYLTMAYTSASFLASLNTTSHSTEAIARRDLKVSLENGMKAIRSSMRAFVL